MGIDKRGERSHAPSLISLMISVIVKHHVYFNLKVMLYLCDSYNRAAKTILIKRKRRHILYHLNSTLALTGLDDENNNRGEIQPNPWRKPETDVQYMVIIIKNNSYKVLFFNQS